MNVVVTGGAGYLGSMLCLRLLESGCSVRVLDSLLYGGAPLLPLLGHRQFRLVEGDMRDGAARDAVLDGADAVVHLAAIVGDPACARDPRLAVAVNLEASVNLVDAAIAHGVSRFIFASTCSNYGRMADTSVMAKEDHELRPVSVYAETKVAVERRLLAADVDGMCPVVYRFATLYGLSPRMRFDLTVNEFTMEMVTRGKLTVFGEQFWRPYVHVRDAAQAILQGLKAPAGLVRRQVFNIGSTAENYRKQDIVRVIQGHLRKPAKVETVAKAEDPRDYRVSFEKVRRVLGFKPAYTVADGVAEIVFAIEHGIVGGGAARFSNVAAPGDEGRTARRAASS